MAPESAKEAIDIRLGRLSVAGLPTPRTLTVTHKTFGKKSSKATFYARASFMGRRLSVVGDQRRLHQYMRNHPDQVEWQIQEVIPFVWSGAALIGTNEIILEAVVGNPIALLRYGHLRLRASLTDGTQYYSQEEIVRMTPAGISRESLEESTDVPSAHQLATFKEQLRRAASAGLPSIVEWGAQDDSRVVFLDHKLLEAASFDRLRAIALAPGRSEDMPDGTTTGTLYSFPSLDLCPQPLPPGATHFATGARLSHVVTRSDNGCDVSFLN